MTWYRRVLTAAAVSGVVVLAVPAEADPGHEAAPVAASGGFHFAGGVFEVGVVLAGRDSRWDEDGRDRRRDRRSDRWERRRDRERDRWDRRNERRHRESRRDRDRWSRDDHRGRNRGPEFCRSGAGHPRHGMRWCFEKGFAPRHSRWLEFDPGYVAFGPRRDGKSYHRRLRGYALDDVLGPPVVQELLYHRSAIGAHGRLVGEWQRPRELYPARVLEVRAGELPIAEFIDMNDDGVVDVAYLLDPWG